MINKLALTIPGGYEFKPVGGMPTLGSNGLSTLIQFSVTMLLILASLLSLSFLIWGGIQWIVSGGDKNAVDAARKRVTYAIIGLLIVFLSFLIISLIGYFFDINLLNIPEPLRNPIDCPLGAGGCR